MQLQTFVNFDAYPKKQVDYNSKILFLGSCFSENMGVILEHHKFDVLQNPSGILFHPKAIENLIVNSIQQKQINESKLVLTNEIWYSLDAHSTLNDVNINLLIEKLELAQKQTLEFLKSATHIMITLGTAWVYKYLETNKIVANCHKIPQKKFEKLLLSVSKIEKSLQNSVEQIQQINKNATIIFTISPVRHAKNGLVENMLSKAHLLTAVHQIISKNQQLFYFPAYEIMMDELRDYRYYAEDMLHPNQTAIHYIWEKFSQIWIDVQAKPLMQEIDEIQKSLQHKPFYPESENHQQFLKKLNQKITALQQKLPHITF